ncbi:MAG: class I SAM-dependent methyltransferase [bacterium]|nr:class I SAM-dependent methyltransferase [bacterium]
MNKDPLILRHQRERFFHNHWAKEIKVEDLLVYESFDAPTAVENQEALHAFGPLKDKRILDLGCGSGEASVYFAIKGAKVVASDISPLMLEVVKRLALHHQVKVQPINTAGEFLCFADESFDYIFGNGVLHHLDLKMSIPQIKRVLKPGGVAFFIEPLAYNPFIKVYRWMAKGVRTFDERPFTWQDIALLKRHFPHSSHKEVWFSTCLIFLYFFLIEKKSPSKERYWKRVIKEAKKIKGPFLFLYRLDSFLLSFFPPLRIFCWNTMLTLRKEL